MPPTRPISTDASRPAMPPTTPFRTWTSPARMLPTAPRITSTASSVGVAEGVIAISDVAGRSGASMAGAGASTADAAVSGPVAGCAVRRPRLGGVSAEGMVGSSVIGISSPGASSAGCARSRPAYRGGRASGGVSCRPHAWTNRRPDPDGRRGRGRRRRRGPGGAGTIGTDRGWRAGLARACVVSRRVAEQQCGRLERPAPERRCRRFSDRRAEPDASPRSQTLSPG